MTDASFVARIGTDRVIDLEAPPRRARRRVSDVFQRVMHGNHPALPGREWTVERIAAACFLVGYSAICMLVVVALVVARAMGEW